MSEFMQPFIVFFNWLRTFELCLYGFTFTFMDVWIWSAVASVVIVFIVSVFSNR